VNRRFTETNHHDREDPSTAMTETTEFTDPNDLTQTTNLPAVVSRAEWLAARRVLLAQEKEVTRARDRVNADRRRLPMVRIDKPYAFAGPDGPMSLLDLFEGRPQLVMHHFMFGPDWDAACPSCSSAADGISGLRQLHVRNTTVVAVSRAPYPKLAAFRERMAWTFPWYSSFGSDFNYDFHATLDDRVAPVLLHFRTEDELAEVGTPWGGPWTEAMRGEEQPGISAFLRVGDEVFHTYSTFGRGIEEFHNGDPYLDLTALGRQEAWEEPAGRAAPLGLHVGGPALRLPDEYEV
jgi:predicted dithiol-disulfide oxidoreductase (DUF899 family)